MMNRTLDFQLERGACDPEKNCVEMSFSSDVPVERGMEYEVLGHGVDNVDMGRMSAGAPLLLNHDPGKQVGVVERAWVDEASKKCRAQVRFSKSRMAQETLQDVMDGIKRSVSVGYRCLKERVEARKELSKPVKFVERWAPSEISIVSIPADVSVGVGRSDEAGIESSSHKETIVEARVETSIEEKRVMSEVATQTASAPAVDVEKIRLEAVESARKAEVDRIAEIRQIGENLGQRELAESHIVKGSSVVEFRRESDDGLKKLRAEGKVGRERIAANMEAGLSQKEIRSYNLGNLILALANPRSVKAQEAARFELEVSQSLGSKFEKEARGAYIPGEFMKRDTNFLTDSGGGSNSVGTTIMPQSLIEKLEANMVIMGLGPTILSGLRGNVDIPRQTAGATVAHVDESGDPDGSTPTLDKVTLSAKTASARTTVSRTLMQQSALAIDSFVRDELAKRMALKIDYCAINGRGATTYFEPTGILTTTGIGATAWTTASTPTWAKVVELEGEVAQSNALRGSLRYLTSPSFLATLKTTVKAATYPVYLSENGMMNGYPVLTTTHMPAASVLFGNFEDIIVGFWGGLDLIVDNVSANNGDVTIKVFQDYDVVVRHAASFCLASNTAT